MQNWTVRPVFYPDVHDSTDRRFFYEFYGMYALYTEGILLIRQQNVVFRRGDPQYF